MVYSCYDWTITSAGLCRMVYSCCDWMILYNDFFFFFNTPSKLFQSNQIKSNQIKSIRIESNIYSSNTMGRKAISNDHKKSKQKERKQKYLSNPNALIRTRKSNRLQMQERRRRE